MGSLIDLNLYPDPPNTTAGSPTTRITPKIEPKLEPLDEQVIVPPELHPPSFNSPNPNLGIIPHPTSQVDENNVYSEFDRIIEMILTAFGQKTEKCDDFQAKDPDAQAIVPVPEENQLVVYSRRKDPPRSSELVRVTHLGVEDERYFREMMRKTRMIYDSLRVLVVSEDKKQRSFKIVCSPRSKGDLRAALAMKERVFG